MCHKLKHGTRYHSQITNSLDECYYCKSWQSAIHTFSNWIIFIYLLHTRTLVIQLNCLLQWYHSSLILKWTGSKINEYNIIQPENWLLKCNKRNTKRYFVVYSNPCRWKMSWTISIKISILFVNQTSALFCYKYTQIHTQTNITINFIN